MTLTQQVKESIRKRPKSDWADVLRVAGRFRYVSHANGLITIRDPEWVRANIVGLTTQAYYTRAQLDAGERPDLPDWPQTPTLRNGRPAFTRVRQVWVHRLVAPPLLAAWGEIRRRGIVDSIVTFDGLWVPRHILYNRFNPPSIHTPAFAIDFNARTNGYGARPRLNEEVARVFEYYGFSWGGRWRGDEGANDYSKCDGMHFEFCDPIKGAIISPSQDKILTA